MVESQKRLVGWMKAEEKLTANMLSFSCPDSLREQLNQYRYDVRANTRVPPESEAIRALLTDALSRHRALRRLKERAGAE